MLLLFYFSFGVIPSAPLAIHTPLMPNQSIDISLPLNTLGPVMKMEPLNNLQVDTYIIVAIDLYSAMAYHEVGRWFQCYLWLLFYYIKRSQIAADVVSIYNNKKMLYVSKDGTPTHWSIFTVRNSSSAGSAGSCFPIEPSAPPIHY